MRPYIKTVCAYNFAENDKWLYRQHIHAGRCVVMWPRDPEACWTPADADGREQAP